MLLLTYWAKFCPNTTSVPNRRASNASMKIVAIMRYWSFGESERMLSYIVVQVDKLEKKKKIHVWNRKRMIRALSYIVLFLLDIGVETINET